jgi:metal-sulfur cluster biosynthetic enzyme
MEALRGVVDPEVGLDVVTLGLIYDVDATGGGVRIRYTLTTQGCPMGGVLEEGIVEAARRVEGVREVETELVWEPGWNPGMIEDDAWG